MCSKDWTTYSIVLRSPRFHRSQKSTLCVLSISHGTNIGETHSIKNIMTRWLKGYRVQEKGLRRLRKASSSLDQIVPSPSCPTFTWPTWPRILESQTKYEKNPNVTNRDEDNVWRISGKIWIPENDVDLQLKLMVVAHCGTMGHRGVAATESVIREDFIWANLSKDAAEFVKNCIHCIMTRTGEMVPRPLGTALHGNKPNDIIHMDYLYMGTSTCEMKYSLILRDDLSSYVWLWDAKSANSETAAAALARWIACFGTMNWLRGICKEVLRSCKALLSEWHLAPQDWPCVTDCIQSILNHAPLKRLGLRDDKAPKVFRTPLEVFTGLKPSRPLMRALPMSKNLNAFLENEDETRKITGINATIKALDEMHRDLNTRLTGLRKNQARAHDRRCGVTDFNFANGDYVLVRRAQKKGHKLGFVWRGPRRIKSTKTKLTFEVEDLIHKKCEVIHARRLKLYRADLDGADVSPNLMKHAEHTENCYETVLGLKGYSR
eukprot:IDg1006t1